jgi:zinc transport system substrate-binding protein
MRGLLIAAALAQFAHSACTPQAEEAGRPSTALLAFVSVPPQAGIVERIGGERVEVRVFVPTGQEPHSFEPTAKQVVALARARLYFLAGMPFERQLAANNSGPGGRLRLIYAAEGEADSSGNGVEADPHTWLSPPLIRIQAERIAAALAEEDPAHVGEYERNLAAFLRDLDAAQAKALEVLRPYRGRRFYSMHPAFSHFAAAFGLQQVAIEIDGRVPPPRMLRALIARARAEGVRALIVQPQYDRAAAEAVAQAMGAEVVTVDPLAKEVLRNIETVALKIAAALER